MFCYGLAIRATSFLLQGNLGQCCDLWHHNNAQYSIDLHSKFHILVVDIIFAGTKFPELLIVLSETK